MLKRKAARTAILYARVKPKTLGFIRSEARRYKFKSQAEFVDAVFTLMYLGFSPKRGIYNWVQNDRKPTKLLRNRLKIIPMRKLRA